MQPAGPCGRLGVPTKLDRAKSKRLVNLPNSMLLIGHAKNQDGATTCLARESPQNPRDGQDPQKGATPRGTLLAASDILIAAMASFNRALLIGNVTRDPEIH